MSKTLYLECYSGISGDMVTAALLDLGADEAVLKKALASLPVDGFEVKISRVKKAGLDACDFDVLLDKEHENHDHDMEYLYGHTHQPEEIHDHEHEHEHDHHHDDDHAHEAHMHDGEHLHSHEDHHHDHEAEHCHDGHCHEGHDHPHEHHHHHEHRQLGDVLHILEHADLTDNARSIAVRIFTILGQAEAKAHGTTLENVHFHEVGTVDSIVDITAAAVCLDNLGIQDVIIPVLYEGTGSIRCQHGILPIPVPAVANIAAQQGLNLHITSAKGEYVTPTGAAIAAAIRTSSTLPENFVPVKIGMGAGKREQELPGLVRAMLIEPVETAAPQDTICKLETNVDDCSGEALGFVMERLFAAGARDVQYSPVYMKKNRPAYLLTVLCKPEDADALQQILFADTTTIGVRRQLMQRSVLERKSVTAQTSFGAVQIKQCTLPGGGAVRSYPEYESVAEICRKTGLPYPEVYNRIAAELAAHN